MWKAVRDRPIASTSVVSDIHDGRHYKKFASEGNLTLLANTDGMQLFKSSPVAMWPMWVTINELPIKMRYKKYCLFNQKSIYHHNRFSKKNMILAGLWCNAEKPNILKPLMTSANELHTNGNID